MTTFLFTLTVSAMAMVAMATGVILSNRVLQGSCGGVGSKDCLCALEKRRLCSLAKQRGGKAIDLTAAMSSEQPVSRP